MDVDYWVESRLAVVSQEQVSDQSPSVEWVPVFMSVVPTP